jgi:mono/diheme cytochrome c family protein
MRSLSARLVLCLLAAVAPVFAEPDLGKLPPPATKTGVTYAADIRPIFEVSCFRCHGADRQKGKLRLDSLEAVLKGSEDGPVVVPGDSTKSPLVVAIARLDPDTAMPPMRKQRNKGGPPAGGPPGAPPPQVKPLTPEQVGLVRAWIDQGAK